MIGGRYKQMDKEKKNTGKEFKTKKRFGQCFLKDKDVIRKIVSLSNPSKDISVIEVGPGLGALTEELLKYYKGVIAYEIDREAIEFLKSIFSSQNLKIIEADILKVDIDKELEDIKEEVVSISNLPYYITSPIIDLFMKSKKVMKMCFMVQREMAERITAKVNTKDYNAFSVMVQYKAEVKTLIKVSRKCFSPEPNVDSSVIEIVKKERSEKAEDEAFFQKFVYASFAQRRKMLVNNLEGFLNKTKEEIKIDLLSLGINENARAETLTIQDFINLSNYFGGKL